MRSLSILILLAFLCSCGSESTPGADLTDAATPAPTDPADATDAADASDDVEPSGSSDASVSPDPSTDSTEAADSADPTDAADPAETSDASDAADAEEPVDDGILRFVVLGDAGEGNQNQYDVADAIQELCTAQGGCEFALYLGDNFYDDGINEDLCLDDPQFLEKFEYPYANLDFPFYVVAGNHDYGLVPIRLAGTTCEVEYHQVSEKWYFPDRYYTVEVDDVALFAVDTNVLMVDQFIIGDIDADDQKAWFNQAVAESNSMWKFAFGHHPYLSNGPHGNAGNYEGLPASLIPIVNGEKIQDFVEESVCGKIDIYFSGHDHSRQWFDNTCGTEFVVSGAGSKTSEIEGRDNNPTLYNDADLPGFLYVEIDSNLMVGRFFDINGDMNFERTVLK